MLIYVCFTLILLTLEEGVGDEFKNTNEMRVD